MNTNTTNLHAIDAHIRWWVRHDLHETLEIERQSFDDPWTEEEMIACSRQRNTILKVAEHNDRVIGYMIYGLYNDRFEILNLAVSRIYRRCEVGSQLVGELLNRTGKTSRTKTTAIIADWNLDAQLFFKSHGFEATEVLRGYYDNNDADCYRMEYKRSGP